MPFKKIDLKDIVFEPEVQKYCVNPNFTCPNYGHSWTCPPEAPYMEEKVSKYNEFYLTYLKFDLVAHVKEQKIKYPRRSEKSIRNKFYMKHYLRDDFEREILKFLDNYSGNFKEKLILWDGHCRICSNKKDKGCTYDSGNPCRYPDKKMYSMEAVGIHVSKTLKNLNLGLEWPPINYYYRIGLICLN